MTRRSFTLPFTSIRISREMLVNVLGALLLGTAACLACATEVAGVQIDDTQELARQKLVLNGAGVRYKAVFKVYTAALYLPQNAATTEDALKMKGPKRVAITMLRSIDAAELGKLFTRGVEDNAPLSERSRLVPGLIRMGEMFAAHRQLKAGDTFQIDWIPGQGTVITVKGQPQGEPYKEPEFFNALLRIWLGPNPADWKLKDALLGKAPA
ncbi:MAG TPA: chalcone isomerase family protein [Burkholderiaceae bacterium]|jgi:hypothetical protein|nr:chalcone isomerase family protein [Burkholderiaceae bacterium]